MFCSLVCLAWAAFSWRTGAQTVGGAPIVEGARAAQAVPAVSDMPLTKAERTRIASELLANLNAPPYGWFASTDARHKNLDYVRIKPNESVRVPLVAGRLVRLWGTASMPRKLELHLENGGDTKLLGDGAAARGVYEEKTYLWYPRPDEALADLAPTSALVATNRGEKQIVWYYQASVRPLGATKESDLPDLMQGEKTVAVDGVVPESRTLAAFMVTKLRIEGLAPTLANLQNTRLQIVSRNEMLVDVPLAPLVGAFEKEPLPFHDAMTAWDGQTLELFWPMPFAGETSMRLLKAPNAGAPNPTLTASIVTLPRDLPYRFRAAIGSGESVRGTPFSLLAVEGAGAFVGGAHGGRAQRKIDALYLRLSGGQRETQRRWHHLRRHRRRRFLQFRVVFPAHAVSSSLWRIDRKTLKPTNSSMYRLMLADAVPFQKKFEFQQEVGYNNTWDNLNYRWIVFWYQKPSARAQVADTLAD